jgi:hypothetical protein
VTVRRRRPGRSPRRCLRRSRCSSVGSRR